MIKMGTPNERTEMAAIKSRPVGTELRYIDCDSVGNNLQCWNNGERATWAGRWRRDPPKIEIESVPGTAQGRQQNEITSHRKVSSKWNR